MPLSCSVLVNCYNYGRYVGEAIDSALNQTLQPLEVIVVNDGSTDNTREVLEKYALNPKVKIIHQRNGGQGSALVAGLERAEGDLVFLLDADDQYDPTHLETVERAYAADRDVDYIYTAYREFGARKELKQDYPANRMMGESVVASMTKLRYVGAICSCITLRRNLGLALLPVMRQVAPRWKKAGDDLFNYGSSIAGARKLYLAGPTVHYRIHETNTSYHTLTTWVNHHGFLRATTVALYCDHLGVRPEIANRTDVEFATIEKPTPEEYKLYRQIVWELKLPLLKRLKMLMRLRLLNQGRKDMRLGSLVGKPPSANE